APAVGDGKAHRKILPAYDAAFLYQTTEAKPRARLEVLLGQIGRRIEKHDRILERTQHQAHGEREHAECRSDQNQSSLLAGHLASNISLLASNISLLASNISLRTSVKGHRALLPVSNRGAIRLSGDTMHRTTMHRTTTHRTTGPFWPSTL